MDAAAKAHRAFDRMRRAHERGTGCHLTAEMIAALGITFLGEVWAQDAPKPIEELKS